MLHYIIYNMYMRVWCLCVCYVHGQGTVADHGQVVEQPHAGLLFFAVLIHWAARQASRFGYIYIPIYLYTDIHNIYIHTLCVCLYVAFFPVFNGQIASWAWNGIKKEKPRCRFLHNRQKMQWMELSSLVGSTLATMHLSFHKDTQILSWCPIERSNQRFHDSLDQRRSALSRMFYFVTCGMGLVVIWLDSGGMALDCFGFNSYDNDNIWQVVFASGPWIFVWFSF
jgi:hypothetical protein